MDTGISNSTKNTKYEGNVFIQYVFHTNEGTNTVKTVYKKPSF